MILLAIILLAVVWGYLFYQGLERQAYFIKLRIYLTMFVGFVLMCYLAYQAYYKTADIGSANIIVSWYIVLIFYSAFLLWTEEYHFWTKEYWIEREKKKKSDAERVRNGEQVEPDVGWGSVLLGFIIPILFFTAIDLIGGHSLDRSFVRVKIVLHELVRFLSYSQIKLFY